MFEMDLAGRPGRKAHAIFAALVALVAALALSTSAKADAFGQLGAFGPGGQGAGQYYYPGPIAIDASDGNALWVTDLIDDNLRLRLRKVGTDGTILGSVEIPSTDGPGGALTHVGAIAIDASEHRVYVLMAAPGVAAANPGSTAAFRVRAYSTTLSGANVVPATGTGITSGVLYGWASAGTGFVYGADGLGVDPVTHKVVVLGTLTPGGTTPALQRISDAGVATAPGDVLVGQEPTGFAPQRPTGIAVGPDGGVYIARADGGNDALIYKMPADGGAATVIATDPRANYPALDAADAGADDQVGYGGPIAISPDGATVYLAEHINQDGAVRGFSTSTGAMSIRYGGGTTTCRIDGYGHGFGVAAGSGGLVAVTLPVAYVNAPTPPDSLIRLFGPNGSGCPRPSESFKVNTASDAVVTVRKGDTVAFDASGSDLLGSTPSSVAWDFDGNGTFETTVGDQALTYDKKFLAAGTFTVGLKISMGGSGGISDDPAVVTKTVKVVAEVPRALLSASTTSPAAGATVTLDGSRSIDPQGSPTAGPTNVLAKYHWDFGDGTSLDTTTPTTTHAFANASAASITRKVALTVSGIDSGTSAPASVQVTVGGTAVANPNPNPSPAPPGPPATTPVTPIRPSTPAVVIPKAGIVSSASVDAKGKAAIKVTCPAGGATCTGKVVLTVKTTKKVKGKKKSVIVTLGTATFTIAAGKGSNVSVRLSSAGKSLLKKSKKLKTSAAVTLTAGGKSATTSKSLTLTVAKKTTKSRH